MQKCIITVRTDDGRVYKSKKLEATPSEIAGMYEVVKRVKKIDDFYITNRRGERVYFNPTHIATITFKVL